MHDDLIHFHRRAEDDVPEVIPPGMTKEQLDFFTEQTERAVSKRLRSYRRSALAGFLVLAIGIGIALFETQHQADRSRAAVVASGKTVAIEGCNRDYERDVKFRFLLQRLKDSARANKTATAEQKATAVAFYDAQLKRFVLPDCRKSESLLTDDPDQKLPDIAPFYEGGPNAPRGSRLPQREG